MSERKFKFRGQEHPYTPEVALELAEDMLQHCCRRMLQPTQDVTFDQAHAGVEFWRGVKKAAKEQIDGEAERGEVDHVRRG